MTDWERIVSRDGPAVWQTAYRLLGNRDEAADCYGQTFLAALELSRREKVRNYGGLLRCLCTCRAMDRLRQRARLSGREEGLADWSNVASANPGPVEEAQAAELSERLNHLCLNSTSLTPAIGLAAGAEALTMQTERHVPPLLNTT